MWWDSSLWQIARQGLCSLHLKSRRPLSSLRAADSKASQTSLLPPQVLINCLRNNICLTVSDPPGRLLFKLSGGLAGFNGAQKTSQKAALAMLDTLQARLSQMGIAKIRLNFRGINATRSIIISQLRRLGLQVTEIVDTTPVPFNGCRPKKSRRL